MGDGPDVPGSSVLRLLSVLMCLGALGMAVYSFIGAGRHPAAVVPGLVILAATVAQNWTPMGETKVGRVGLGVVALGAAVALMGLLYLNGGRNPTSLVFGALFVLIAGVLTFGVPVRDGGRDPLGWVAVAAIGLVIAVTPVLIVVYGPRWLVFGGLALMPAIGLLVNRTTAGPPRFALGLVLAVVTAAMTYFLAIGPSTAHAAFGGAALVALLAALTVGTAPQSTDPTVGDHAVR